MSNVIFYAFLDSTIGIIGFASSSLGIVCLDIGTKEMELLLKLKQKFPVCKLIKSKEKNARAIREIKSYLKGELKSFKSKLDLKGPPKSCRAGTPFQIKVWRQLQKIPYGKTRSYRFIACKSSTCSHPRAVGNAIARNPIPLFIPCHRVINSNGDLGNYGFGKDTKRQLLTLEGAI